MDKKKTRKNIETHEINSIPYLCPEVNFLQVCAIFFLNGFSKERERATEFLSHLR